MNPKKKKKKSPLKLGDFTLISRFLAVRQQVEDLATLGPSNLGQTVAVPFRGSWGSAVCCSLCHSLSCQPVFPIFMTYLVPIDLGVVLLPGLWGVSPQ